MSHSTHQRRVSVILTVKNDPEGIALALDSLTAQSRIPDEIVVVDGGSTNATLQTLQQFTAKLPMLRVVVAPGANIAAGRNRAVREAVGDIIATTDGGCRADPNWLRNLMQPFDADPDVEFVAGFYRVTGVTLLEQVIGLATMRGQMDDVDPKSFNPSARSMALTKELWQRAGGWPEWVNYSEDTLFDLQIRQLGVNWAFAKDAVVDWRPRTSFRSLARQFYAYGTGRGQTGIDAAGYRYNIRNLTIVAASILAWPVTWWAGVITAALSLYFGWWAHHGLARRVGQRLHASRAYFCCIAVMNVVMVAGACGYVAGWWRGRSGGQARPSHANPLLLADPIT